jgi:hypothetical protein
MYSAHMMDHVDVGVLCDFMDATEAGDPDHVSDDDENDDDADEEEDIRDESVAGPVDPDVELPDIGGGDQVEQVAADAELVGLVTEFMDTDNTGARASGSASMVSIADAGAVDDVVELDLDSVLHMFSLSRAPTSTRTRTDILHSSGDECGRVHVMWTHTLKCICKQHNDCSLMVRVNWFGGHDRAMYRIVKWLAASKAVGVTGEADHFRQAQAIIAEGKAAAQAMRTRGV